MKAITTSVLAAGAVWILCGLAAAHGTDAGPSVDSVTFRDGKMFMVLEGQTLPMTNEVVLPGDIKVQTNGLFKVKGGKERQFKEGQTLDAQGNLHGADGSLSPVVDHVTMNRGRLTVVRDGEPTIPGSVVTLGNGTRVQPDGTYITKGGRRSRLLDGQILKLEGGEIPAQDTVTLKDGQVTVQKDGSMLRVEKDRSLMMSDGTRVFGDGTVISNDGKKVTLTEGQVLILPGAKSLRR